MIPIWKDTCPDSGIGPNRQRVSSRNHNKCNCVRSRRECTPWTHSSRTKPISDHFPFPLQCQFLRVEAQMKGLPEVNVDLWGVPGHSPPSLSTRTVIALRLTSSILQTYTCIHRYRNLMHDTVVAIANHESSRSRIDLARLLQGFREQRDIVVCHSQCLDLRHARLVGQLRQHAAKQFERVVQRVHAASLAGIRLAPSHPLRPHDRLGTPWSTSILPLLLDLLLNLQSMIHLKQLFSPSPSTPAVDDAPCAGSRSHASAPGALSP